MNGGSLEVGEVHSIFKSVIVKIGANLDSQIRSCTLVLYVKF